MDFELLLNISIKKARRISANTPSIEFVTVAVRFDFLSLDIKHFSVWLDA